MDPSILSLDLQRCLTGPSHLFSFFPLFLNDIDHYLRGKKKKGLWAGLSLSNLWVPRDPKLCYAKHGPLRRRCCEPGNFNLHTDRASGSVVRPGYAIQTPICTVTQLCLTLCDPVDCSPPTLPKEFSRQEYWRGLPFPTPGYHPNPGIEPIFPTFPVLISRFFTTNATWEAPCLYIYI